jgi:hypothetical protein
MYLPKLIASETVDAVFLPSDRSENISMGVRHALVREGCIKDYYRAK